MQNEAAHRSPALAARVAAVIAGFRPYVLAHGGDIELLGVDEQRRVRVRLKGACVGCPASVQTLQFGLEQELRAAVPEVGGVIPVP